MTTVGSYQGQEHGRGYVAGWANWYCRECGAFNAVPPGGDDPRRCSTPGCTRATGFGKFQGVPAPRAPAARELRR